MRRAGASARASRSDPAMVAVLIVGMVALSAVIVWFQIEGHDVKAAATTYGQPEEPPSAVASQLPFALEATLIASSTQAAMLADLRLRVHQAEALSDSYAARLAEEQARRRSLEEALAARQERALPSSPSAAPSPAEAGRLEEPPLSTPEESLQPTEQFPEPATASIQSTTLQHAPTAQPPQPEAVPAQPPGELPQPATLSPPPVAELVQATAELPPPPTEPEQSTAEWVQPAGEPLPPTTSSLPPTREQAQPAGEPVEPPVAPLGPAAEPLQSSAGTSAPARTAAVLGRLMVRARELREQGDIAAARTVLERPADDGHGTALFELAETYDPNMLSAWRTLGTKGDVAKARQLYRRAEEAGVVLATERLKGLPD